MMNINENTTKVNPLQGTLFRRIRNELGLTQRALAKALDTTQASVNSYDQGHITVPPRKALLLLKVLKQKRSEESGNAEVKIYSLSDFYGNGEICEDFC